METTRAFPIWLRCVLLLVVFCVAVWFIWPCPTAGTTAGPTTVVILVRHAEKESGGSDPGLTPAGHLRARELARVAGPAKPTAAFATQYQRTRLTVAPLASSFGLTVIQKDTTDVQGLVDAIRNDHAGSTVVVAGHSFTLSGIIAALGGPTIADLAESSYGNLYVITICGSSGTRLTRLKYGAP